MKITVLGLPVTEGSVRAYPGRNGGAYVVQGGSADRRRRLDDWRHAIRSEAQRELEAGAEPFTGAVAVHAAFGLPKPAAAPKRRRTYPIKARSGDIDKLLRAVLDALTGVLWADDSQVVTAIVSKDWSDRPGLVLRVIGGEYLQISDA